MFSFNCFTSTWFSDASSNFDIISELPLEISLMIFRKYLNGADINAANSVSKRWRNFCRSDKKIREKLITYRRNKEKAYKGLRFYRLCKDSGSLKETKTLLKKKKKNRLISTGKNLLCLSINKILLSKLRFPSSNKIILIKLNRLLKKFC
ncbi:uncharacterized protein LOC126901851 isoform X2 [Daktulosphaira vitifoliae]|uniref:uncharacterized protein LOC126901851 isoform X2 n=1 Tax=Daktulosphaira vitifoliae TaxID=58002 RepID=UPI0021A9D02E|nr:uncharacterized protein LOC126901851 isoform X2 [Daktulosphaira vitifoliae]